ncbi:MAG: fibronectin type III domain-containing protein [Blastocatellia bacterium]
MKTSAGIFCKSGARRRAIALLCLAIAGAGCGKIGDPLPPIPRASLLIEELRVDQQGTLLQLSFPFSRTPRAARVQRLDIYRVTEALDDPMGVTAESFATRASLIAAVPVEQLLLRDSAILFTDPLDLKTIARNIRYRYAVRLINTNGQAADLSNYAVIRPLFDLAVPPGRPRAMQREKEIEITWAPPAVNESGTEPANAAAYHLYRRAGGEFVRINPEPLLTPRFVDREFQFGASYEYAVSALSHPLNDANLANAIESNRSELLAYTPKDVFPPAAPTSVTIASINSSVSLFWPLNTEPDVEGYNIYRSEDESAPPAQWIRLNPTLHKTASFRDDRVLAGKKYAYQITAVDAYGNESPRSEKVSEIVAP